MQLLAKHLMISSNCKARSLSLLAPYTTTAPDSQGVFEPPIAPPAAVAATVLVPVSVASRHSELAAKSPKLLSAGSAHIPHLFLLRPIV
ncbi:hypothetical protein DL765_000320 [Monosporascus sp. GIB2]|nr:hypothetical protein DL765_000320 [Monosporascus sp. GIB2]